MGCGFYPQELWKTLCLGCQTALSLWPTPNVHKMTNSLQHAKNITAMAFSVASIFSLKRKKLRMSGYLSSWLDGGFDKAGLVMIQDIDIMTCVLCADCVQ